ncbi:exported hypothetical protein [Streptomyces misionensis JCM 4497]
MPSASSALTPSASWLSPVSSLPRRSSAPSSTACSASRRSVTGCGMPRTYPCAVSRPCGSGLRMPAKKPPSGCRRPSARNRSSRPRWSSTSMLRTCRPSARTIPVGSVSFSSTTVRTPCSRSSAASISPVGPPPAMITSIKEFPPCTQVTGRTVTGGPPFRLVIVRREGGLAARPPTRYTLRVARSMRSLPFLFSPPVFVGPDG